MTASSALVVWAYNADGSRNQDRVDWLVAQRDLLVSTQFGGGKAVSSLTSAGGKDKIVGFQIDLPGPEKLQVITDALESLGVIPSVALPTRMTHACFARLER